MVSRFLEDFRANLSDSSETASVQFIASHRAMTCGYYFHVIIPVFWQCAAARVQKCHFKSCFVLVSPSLRAFNFTRCVCGCDCAWLGNWFKLILNSFPLMSVHRRLCVIWGWQFHKRHFLAAVIVNDGRKSILNCSIIPTNWQNTMERSSQWSQKLSPFCDIDVAFRLAVKNYLHPLFFLRSLLFGRDCWYCQKYEASLKQN